AQAEHRLVRAIALALGLRELHRLQQRILPVPDVDYDFLVVIIIVFRLRLGSRRSAEEDALTVRREADAAAVGDPPAVSDPGGRGGRDDACGIGAAIPVIQRPGRILLRELVDVREERDLAVV